MKVRNGRSQQHFSDFNSTSLHHTVVADLPELLNMIARAEHGGIKGIADDFMSRFPGFTKQQVQSKIDVVGVREKRPGDQRKVWYIRPQFLSHVNAETKAYLAAMAVLAVPTSPAPAAPSAVDHTPFRQQLARLDEGEITENQFVQIVRGIVNPRVSATKPPEVASAKGHDVKVDKPATAQEVHEEDVR